MDWRTFGRVAWFCSTWFFVGRYWMLATLDVAEGIEVHREPDWLLLVLFFGFLLVGVVNAVAFYRDLKKRRRAGF